MAVSAPGGASKRKRTAAEESSAHIVEVDNGNLDMLSDDEAAGEDAESDDGHLDEFPEIDEASDSEDSEDEFEGADSEEDDTDATSDTDADSIHVGPQAKTIISDITGQPKRVYPEIDPDYDSDSSTEDVCSTSYMFCASLR